MAEPVTGGGENPRPGDPPQEDPLPEGAVRALASASGVLVPGDWPFARERAAEVAAHWARRRAARPGLWNGRVLVARSLTIVAGPAGAGDALRADLVAVDYAAFLAWQDLAWQDPARKDPAREGDARGPQRPRDPGERVRNLFACTALRGADGAYVLGRMGPRTANAGQVYHPAGTPDLSDADAGGRVDLAASAARELREETGLAEGPGEGDLRLAPGWTAVRDGPRAALVREARSALPAAALAARVRAHIAAQGAGAEFDALVIVRGPADLDPATMPAFVRRHLARAFAGRAREGAGGAGAPYG